MVRKQQRRKRRSSRRGRGLRKRMSSAPPRLSITSNTRNINVAYAVAPNANGDAMRQIVSRKIIFDFPPNKGLRFQYHQARILSARIYWQSDSSTSDAGSVCLNVCDASENTGTTDCDFVELLSYPGSMIRKVWQNVSNRWFPTEPSDREFLNLDSDEPIFVYTVRHSITGGKLKGRLMISLNIKVRGKTTTRAMQELIAKEYLDSTTRDLDMVVIEPSASST